MIILKYSKADIFAYLSFLDIRNAFKRTMNRAKITTKMSQGFNPHELVYFNDPDSLGIVSKADYALIETDIEPDYIMTQFNINAPKGLKIEKIAKINEKINFNKIFDCANYKFVFENEIAIKNILELFNKDKIEVEKKSKDNLKIVDIKPKIHNIEIMDSNSLNILLSYGQEKLSPFLAVDYICKNMSIDKKTVKVIKENVYSLKDREVINVDEIFFI